MAAIKPVFKANTPASHRLQLRMPPRLAWEAARVGRKLGWPGAIGIACMALAVFALQQAGELGARLQHLTAQLAVAAKQAALPQAATRLDADADSLAAFHAYLPAHDTIPEQLKELLEVAQRTGVTLAKADYKPQEDGNTAFLRYQISLPVKAEYAQLQAFIVEALQAVPTLTLDSVLFKREQIEAGEIDARIQFILLVKKPEARA
ncbi:MULTISPECIES: type 4a pilus biogenesis protein PilO [unclassified Janthinobacterium]|uniref:type 4a pilus biogenesis protein PilO n=1 Tax=unclassified Janthinobacterium TaxID=2610881 RepID=UPI0016230A03|nr:MULTISPECIES: type 4a pilus biogenesis protein PilO [unclassified Janthinobacterium]MBB5607493.1 Tfp pilus assembly protein PilO [Janthinobacterium sp. S3T4]MBB5612514.1 Tfp pilus assembly protein PilO [Janthinobacterium sp. S3M3]